MKKLRHFNTDKLDQYGRKICRLLQFQKNQKMKMMTEEQGVKLAAQPQFNIRKNIHKEYTET